MSLFRKLIVAQGLLSKGSWALTAFLLLLLRVNSFADASDSLKQLRIVSLAPNITEIVFALKKEDSLFGVTRFCDYPEKARMLPRVGGLSDLNLEQVVSLEPTLVLGLPEHSFIASKLESYNTSSLLTSYNSLEEILNSIELIGNALGAEDRALSIVSKIRNDIKELESLVSISQRPSVLVTVGGHVKAGSLDTVYAAGSRTLFDELITKAGGRNVFSSNINYAKLTAEGILSLNPDVIIDLVPSDYSDSSDVRRGKVEDSLAAWNSLAMLNAVRSNRVLVFTEDFVVNPGPRVVETLRLFSKAMSRDGGVGVSD